MANLQTQLDNIYDALTSVIDLLVLNAMVAGEPIERQQLEFLPDVSSTVLVTPEVPIVLLSRLQDINIKLHRFSQTVFDDDGIFVVNNAGEDLFTLGFDNAFS